MGEARGGLVCCLQSDFQEVVRDIVSTYKKKKGVTHAWGGKSSSVTVYQN